MTILLNSTPTALWHDIIHDAEATCSITLKQELEAYLVSLMMRFTNQPQMVKALMATEFMEGVSLSPRRRHVVLQDVGDKCLLFTGLFPKIAEKRLVKISYYVNIGQAAYSTMSKTRNDLYSSLARHFVPLMDILQSIRRYAKEYPDLMPLEAFELWNETGSKRALQVLGQYTKAIPIEIKSEKFDK